MRGRGARGGRRPARLADRPVTAPSGPAPAALAAFLSETAGRAPLYRTLLLPGGDGPLGRRLHRELRARAVAERAAVGAPHPELVGSAVAAAFTGVLADWLHEDIRADPEALADHLWRLLMALHRAIGPGGGPNPSRTR